MELNLLLIIPLVTAIGVLFAKGKTIRTVALAGAEIQLIYSIYLVFEYLDERAAGSSASFLLQSRYSWFPAWHIDFYFGIDGISLAMILLTAVVVFAGILVSWNIEKMKKEFFLLLVLLSAGAYGFFCRADCSTSKNGDVDRRTWWLVCGDARSL